MRRAADDPAVGDEARRLLGYEPEELVNQTTDLIYSDRRPEAKGIPPIHSQLENVGFHVGAAEGTYWIIQEVANGPLTCRHQLTADVSSIEKRELSITRVVDYTAKFMRAGLRNFIGKFNITQGKFILGDGGLARMVWMPKILKGEIKERLLKRGEELGIPDLIDRIADETVGVTEEEILPFLQEKKHPALDMDPIIGG